MFGEGNNWIVIAILGAFFVLMIVMTYLPQRKQKKKMAEMFSSISVGDKIMTIGGIVGVITEINPESDRYIVNVGTETTPTYLTIIKNAIRSKIS